MSTRKRVVIIGGGFAGLNAVQSLAKADVDVTLIDRRNFHLFQPLLYQVATGGLSPANIAAPIRGVVQNQPNARVLMDEVTQVDPRNNCVKLKGGEAVFYDFLIVAAGARNDYFGHPEWEQHAPGLKTVEDATAIRRRIFQAFEDAELERDPRRVKALLTFVVIGAGPTGVEMAGAIAEIARDTLRQNFRKIDPASARIVLLDGADRVLAAMHPALSACALKRLEGLGVDVQLKTKVVRLESGLVEVECDARKQVLLAETKIWAAGVRASALGEKLAAALGVETDRGGRVVVGPDLSVPGFANIFVIGDLAHACAKDGSPLPGLATVAIQQGKFVAKLIHARMQGKTVAAFSYFDKGSMATIGRGAAVAQIGGLRIGGWLAWIMWLFVHQMYIVAFNNRLLVMLQWGWSYFTFGRSARLITGAEISRSAPPASMPPSSSTRSTVLDAEKTPSVDFENRTPRISGRGGNVMNYSGIVRKSLRLAQSALDKVSFSAPLLARLVVGYIFFQSGHGKLGNLEGTTQFFTSLGIPAPHEHAIFIACLEFVGGMLLMAGLFTRPIAALLGGTMVVALLTADRMALLDAWHNVGDKTLIDVAPVVLGMFLLYLLTTGPGKLSVDHWIKRALKLDRPEAPEARTPVAMLDREAVLQSV